MISEYLELLKNSPFFFIKVLLCIIIGCIESYYDIVKMEIHSYFLIALTVLIVLFNIFIDIKIFYVTFFGVLAVIIIYLIIYTLSSGGIGLGDMVFCSFLTSIFGIAAGIGVLFISNWLAAMTLLPFILKKKVVGKTKIPMIPFQYAVSIGIIVLMYSTKSI
ncbi:MAG: hypothetical protein A2015_14670 [Spirochaetes bacterium GWF1_31_7]|nr:MAG: hypothetical protein A2Y30_10355 [Spirochaetes bacterium GWE1_32_154]OHD47079.1 MAG: hypothetical protein A2Y29_02130 [Spirochaetes bacterium GWE2_31_10]OHD51722.1 MAG: hypothetical protein A2015_14670 [Spirochaetes bacterium GWF1_31_7]OHD79039.1 MAG: hypothetical protein A2355_03305 [Spirochaetes bacterium RIFOXYB1_FULL_32_8]HBD92688.1 hypothetical protein [Spirochaetia bacterium]